MIEFNEINSLNIRLRENQQKISLFELTSGETKQVVISILKKQNKKIKNKISKYRLLEMLK